MSSDPLSTDSLAGILPGASSVPAPQRKSPEREMEAKARRRSHPEEENSEDAAGEIADAPSHQLDDLV